MLVEDQLVTIGGTLAASWATPLAAWRAYMLAAGWSPGTISVKLKYLRRVERSVADGRSPFELTEDDLLLFLGNDNWSPETRKSARSAVRGFYGWAFESRRTETDVSARLPAVKTTTPPPRPAPDSALEHALGAAPERVRLMVLLAARAGLRRAEIASLHTSNIDGVVLRVKGKGQKVREVPIHPDIAEYLQGLPEGYVFPGNDCGHLSPDRVGRLMADALPDNWTAHTLRHRFATRSYAGTRDLFTVQRLLGHASAETTRRYTATSNADAVAAVMAS